MGAEGEPGCASQSSPTCPATCDSEAEGPHKDFSADKLAFQGDVSTASGEEEIAVKMVGWGVDNGVKYWKVANSWNPYWGEKGYFRIKKGNNEGGIEDQVTFSDP